MNFCLNLDIDPINGLSRINILGFSIIACTMPNFCLIPKKYFPDRLFSKGVSPTNRRTSSIRFHRRYLKFQIEVNSFIYLGYQEVQVTL